MLNSCQISQMCSKMATFSAGANPEEGTGGPDPPLKNHKKGFLSNTGPDPLKNHRATKPAFNVGPSKARQRNAI